jgi:hypothetical protein
LYIAIATPPPSGYVTTSCWIGSEPSAGVNVRVSAEDVADRPVRGPPHLLQAELLDPRLVRGDRRALDADAVLLDRVRRVHRDLVVGRVPVLDRQVVVPQVDVEVRVDQALLDELPDDPRHLVAVELDDRTHNPDLRHAPQVT